MKKFLLYSLTALILTSCATPLVVLNSQFDENHAKSLMQKGNNKITGSGFMRQNGGGVVTCAGQEVLLTPATDYAKERMIAIYGSDVKGMVRFNIANVLPITKFANEPASYRSYSARTVCDAQGNFTFDAVADGEFYITGVISWNIGNPSFDFGARQGGAVMQKVSVQGGEIKKILLTP